MPKNPKRGIAARAVPPHLLFVEISDDSAKDELVSAEFGDQRSDRFLLHLCFLLPFFFEIQNRIRRPAVYIYFLALLIFTVSSFATGSLPVGEKEHINAPYLIAFWCSGMTMMMMLIRI